MMARPAVMLGVLTLINLLNYLDRYVIAGIKKPLCDALNLDGKQYGLLTLSFMLTYMLASPLAGYLGDRVQRKYLIAAGVILWSIATAASGLAQDKSHLFIARAFTGIGEAGYATVAPGIISDLYDRSRRGKMLSVFYAAIPVGSALGFVTGGLVAVHFGWRSAFFVAGAPGLVLALVAAMLPEPVRGANDEGETELQPPPMRLGLSTLRANPQFMVVNVGYTLLTFAIGGLANWMPDFFVEVHHVPLDAADSVFGTITVVSGFLGTAAGGWAGERAVRRHPGGYLWISGLGLVLGVPLVLVAAFSPTLGLAYAAASAAMFFLFFNTGPINTALVNCVPSNLRALAVSVNIFCIHAFGDAISSFILGAIADVASRRIAVAFTALPIVIGGLVLLAGARRVPSQATPAPLPAA
ncbi:MAG: MFS transporter [Deltaproteobacteria bacterium]|nr:MFS transporter [Deltaproteobacteria bacterium]